MFYLITQLLLLLAIASLLSGAIGWLCRRYFTEQAHQDEINDHKRAGRAQMAEIDDLRHEITDRNTQVASLNSKLHYNAEAMQRAESEREALLRDIEELQGLEGVLSEVEQDRALLDQHLAEAEAELEEARKARLENEEALKNAIALKEQTVAALTANAADKEKQLKAALALNTDKDKQLKDAAAAQARSDKQLREIAVTAAENDEKLRSGAAIKANLEDIIASLNEDIINKTAERDEVNQKHALLSAEFGRLEQKLTQTEQDRDAQVNDLEKSLRQHKDSVAVANQAIAAGEEKLKAVNATLAERTQERHKLEKLCEEQQQQIAALNREIAKSQKAAADAQMASQKQLAKLEQDLDKQKTVAELADRQITREVESKTQLQNDMQHLRGEIEEIQARRDAEDLAAAQRLEQQKLATNQAAVAAEKQLAELKRENSELKKSADARLNDLHQSETTAAKLAEKAASAEARANDLQNRLADQGKSTDRSLQELRNELKEQAGKLASQESELRDAVNQALDLQNSLADYQSSDAELRAMIEKLQRLLSEERRSAGQTLLARIRELETMLDAERRKADELKSAGPEIGQVKWQSKSTVHSSAANASTVHTKKTGTDTK